MGGGGAPKPDPNMGIAALKSAETGQQYLEYMKELGDISTAWAEEDRDRWNTVFRPIEDDYVAKAANWDTQARRAERRESAEADVLLGISGSQEAERRRQAAMGIRPDSGRAIATSNADNVRKGLARAGARNLSDRSVEQEGMALKGQAVSLGKGYAINPATSLGLGGQLSGRGFEGQMQGYNQQASILKMDHEARMDQWSANQQSSMALWSGIGTIAGMFLSSKDYKTDRSAPKESPLDQVKSMPVEEYRYKDGIADGGSERHIGPMAEDFQAATGRGDGRTISVQDAVGTTMGAVQELAAKVDRIEQAVSRKIQPPKRAAA